MSYFGHQTLHFEILDLGRMVTNILSGLNMHATETFVYGYLGLINIRCETCATAASTAAATAATATAYPAFAAVTTV